jgi:hypothetical protein
MNIKDFAIGGVAGAVLAVVGTLYFSGAAATAPGASTGAAPAEASPQPAPAVAASGASSVGRGGASTMTAAAPAVAGAACPPAVAAADPRKPASAAAGPGAARLDVPAVALSAEHAKMLLDESARPPSLPELHARFASEPLDPAWSQQMEAQIRQTLQEAGVQKGFELLAVECRLTLCELRLFGTGPNSGQRWGALSGQLAQQSWWAPNFSGTSSSTTDMNDRAVIATLLHRAKR